MRALIAAMLLATVCTCVYNLAYTIVDKHGLHETVNSNCNTRPCQIRTVVFAGFAAMLVPIYIIGMLFAVAVACYHEHNDEISQGVSCGETLCCKTLQIIAFCACLVASMAFTAYMRLFSEDYMTSFARAGMIEFAILLAIAAYQRVW
jgi:hypothetical protein